MKDIRAIIEQFELSAIGRYRIEILAAAIVIVATLFFYYYIYSKNMSELRRINARSIEVKTEIERMSAEIQETQRVAERLKDAMEKLSNMEERFRITQSKLPSEKQLSSILKGLVGDERSDIKFVSLRPMPAEEKGEYFRLPFQMAVLARFRPFGEYLEKIEGLPRIVTVENFRIDVKDESYPLLSIQLFMSTYVLGGKL